MPEAGARRAPDASERRFVRLFFWVALGFGGRMALVSFNGPLARTFTDNGYLIGLLLATTPLVATIANPLFGRLSDRTVTRLGRRIPYALVGVPLSALVVFAIPRAPDFEMLLALFLLQALFLSVCGVPLMSLVPDMVGSATRGRAMALFMIAGGIGAIVIQASGKLFWERNLALVYDATGVLALLFAVPALFFIRERPLARSQAAIARRLRPLSLRTMLRAVERGRPMALFLVSACLRYLGLGLVLSYLTLFAATDLGVSIGDAALAIATAGVLRLLLALPMGRLADVADRRRLLLAATWGAAVLYLCAWAFVQELWQLYAWLAGSAIVGTLEAAAGGTLFMDLLAADRRGELTGVNMVLQNLARAAGALLGGILFASTGGYRVVFPLAACALAASAFVLLRVPSPARPASAADGPAPERAESGQRDGIETISSR